MAQFIEFLGNHPILVGCWLAAFAGILVYHQRTGSKGATPTQAIAMIRRDSLAPLGMPSGELLRIGQ